MHKNANYRVSVENSIADGLPVSPKKDDRFMLKAET